MSEVHPIRTVGQAQAIIAPLVGRPAREIGGYAVIAQAKDDPLNVYTATSAETAVDFVAFLRWVADSLEAQA